MSLIKSNKRERLADVIGHELRNPLASAVASVSVSMEMTDVGDPRATFLTRAFDELTRISTLLTSYLDFGRSGVMNCEELDLVAITHQICDRYRGHPAEVKVTVGEVSVRLHGDPVLLERLIENLVENAISMGASQVEMFCERNGLECTLHVSDNGPGVPYEMREDLFESSFSDRPGGGLGLALCRDVVESHGGTIVLVPSVRGAVFKVSIPDRAANRNGAEIQP